MLIWSNGYISVTVSAVLEHEAIAGLTGSKPSGLRGRSSSRAEDTPEHSLDTLMKSVSIHVNNSDRWEGDVRETVPISYPIISFVHIREWRFYDN